jgi:hypothetical protein
VTRRGSTPYRQSAFKYSLHVWGSKLLVGDDWEKIEARVSSDMSGEDWQFLYGDFLDQGYLRIRMTLTSIGKTGLETYLDSSPSDSLAFGLLIVSNASRQRKFVAGNLLFDPTNVEIVVTGSIDFLLSDFLGLTELEPVILAARDLSGSDGYISVTPGTILGSSNVIRLRDRGVSGPLGDIFEYQWVSFDDDPSRSSGELFDIDLAAPGSRPILYLNEDIENFHAVMNIPDNAAGKPSQRLRARRQLDSTLSAQVIVEALSTIMNRIVVLANERRIDDPAETEFGSIFDELSLHEQSIAEGWRHFLGTSDAHKDGYSVVQEISELNPNQVTAHLSSAMPRLVRSTVGIESAVSAIVASGFGVQVVEEGE